MDLQINSAVKTVTQKTDLKPTFDEKITSPAFKPTERQSETKTNYVIYIIIGLIAYFTLFKKRKKLF